LSSLRILVVEDSAVCAKLFTIVLEKAGFNVTVASSAPEALAYLREKVPDAIVCNLLLGRTGNGYDVVAATRSTGATIPCIAVTGFPAFEIESQALGAGFDFLLRKPLQLSKLVEILLRDCRSAGS